MIMAVYLTEKVRSNDRPIFSLPSRPKIAKISRFNLFKFKKKTSGARPILQRTRGALFRNILKGVY